MLNYALAGIKKHPRGNRIAGTMGAAEHRREGPLEDRAGEERRAWPSDPGRAAPLSLRARRHSVTGKPTSSPGYTPSSARSLEFRAGIGAFFLRGRGALETRRRPEKMENFDFLAERMQRLGFVRENENVYFCG